MGRSRLPGVLGARKRYPVNRPGKRGGGRWGKPLNKAGAGDRGQTPGTRAQNGARLLLGRCGGPRPSSGAGEAASAPGDCGGNAAGCEIRLGERDPPAPTATSSTPSWGTNPGPDSEPGAWTVGPRRAPRPPDPSGLLIRGCQPGGGGVGGRAFPLRVHPRSCHPRLWTAGPCGRPSIWPCPVSSPPLVPATPDICSPFCSGDLRTGGECGGSDCRTLRPRMAVEGGEGRGYQKCKHRVLPSRAPRGNQGSALPAQASSPQASPSPSGPSAQLLGL